MPLKDLEVPADAAPLPGDVRAFLREAERRIEGFRSEVRVPGFVPSDYAEAYRTLRGLAGLAPGNLFCEWGSGFGVVACLAAMLDYDACGIEVEGELVDAARQLAADFELPVQFVRGSFIPTGGEARLGDSTEYAWLTTQEDQAHQKLGLGPEDFSVIFAYPWPDEEQATADLFEHYAGAGAVLVTYHGNEGLRLRRKVSKRSRASRGG